MPAYNESVKIADTGFDCDCVRFYVCFFYGTEGHSVQYGNQKQHSGVCVCSSALSLIPLGKWHVCKTDNYFNLTDVGRSLKPFTN